MIKNFNIIIKFEKKWASEQKIFFDDNAQNILTKISLCDIMYKKQNRVYAVARKEKI